MRSTFFPPAAWGTHQTVIIHILQIPYIFHFPYCISTVRADSFPRSHGGNTTRYAPNFTIPTLFLTLLIEPHATDFLSPAAWGTNQTVIIHILQIPSIFSFSLLYFYRTNGFLSPFARRKYHKVYTQFSLYLPYFFNSPYCTPCG